MRKELAKTYDPKGFEDRIYDFWMKGGYFTAERDPQKTPYTIVIPPPNITGQLHMGHALDETLQDILIRYKKLQGYSALWVPGDRPRLHCNGGENRRRYAGRGAEQRGFRPRGLFKTRVGVERDLWRADRFAAKKIRHGL